MIPAARRRRAKVVVLVLWALSALVVTGIMFALNLLMPYPVQFSGIVFLGAFGTALIAIFAFNQNARAFALGMPVYSTPAKFVTFFGRIAVLATPAFYFVMVMAIQHPPQTVPLARFVGVYAFHVVLCLVLSYTLWSRFPVGPHRILIVDEYVFYPGETMKMLPTEGKDVIAVPDLLTVTTQLGILACRDGVVRCDGATAILEFNFEQAPRNRSLTFKAFTEGMNLWLSTVIRLEARRFPFAELEKGLDEKVGLVCDLPVFWDGRATYHFLLNDG